jgi:hypothetical protein
MPTSFLVRAAGAAVILIALPLAGCESDRSLMSTAPAPAPAAAKPVAPAINMAGRWTLASPGGGMCAMTFTSKAGGAEGNIAPEGGCPGQFYTSRHWRSTAAASRSSTTKAARSPTSPVRIRRDNSRARPQAAFR